MLDWAVLYLCYLQQRFGEVYMGNSLCMVLADADYDGSVNSLYSLIKNAFKIANFKYYTAKAVLHLKIFASNIKIFE
jgi:hypothetical protein